MLHMDRRTFLKGAGVTGLALALSPLESLVNEAQAAHGIPIGEYYDSGVPIDVMSGARKCPKSAVKGDGLGFKYDEWFKYFFDKPQYAQKLQQMFKELDGQRIPINSPQHSGETIVFDYNKFYNFNKEGRGDFKAVTLFYDGFIDFGYDAPTYGRIVIPMDKSIVTKIRKL